MDREEDKIPPFSNQKKKKKRMKLGKLKLRFPLEKA